MATGIGGDLLQNAGEFLCVKRQAQEIKCPGADCPYHIIDIGIYRRDNNRQPDACLPELSEQATHPAINKFIACHDHSLARRLVDDFGNVGVDLGVVAKRQDEPGLLGAGAAVAADDMEDESVCHDHSWCSEPDRGAWPETTDPEVK